MILSRNIPLDVHTFLRHVQRDIHAGWIATDYRGLLIRETNRRYPGLVEGLAHVGRPTRQGQARVIADADHIIPQSLWNILIPPVWNLGGPPPPSPHVLANLFWRTVTCNRGAPSRGEALDHGWILHIKKEAVTKASTVWARQYMEMFLRTKHDEGVNIDVPLDPHRMDQLQTGNDLSDVIEFIQVLRQQRPHISTAEIVDLVENRFPHIRIETDGSGPRIEIG